MAAMAIEDHKALDLFDTREESENWWVVSDTRWLPDGHPYKSKGQWYWVVYPEAYDLAWRWMTEEERSIARGILARIQNNRYTHFMEIPSTRSLINHASMAMLWVSFGMAIEGEEGYNEKAYQFARGKFEEVLDWYISPKGNMYESVKGFLPWQIYLSMARREIGKILQHPHVFAYMRQIFMTAMNTHNNYVAWTRSPVHSGSKVAKSFFDPRNDETDMKKLIQSFK
jgi:hypothetical protein